MLTNNQTLEHWFRFLLGGAINTAFTYGVYYLLQLICFYQIAYAIAYVSGIVFSYWFNATVVFKVKPSWKRLFTYPMVYAAQYCLSAVFLSLFVESLDIAQEIGPILVLLMMIPLTFFLSRWVLTFRST